MLSEKQPEYVHPEGSLTPGAVNKEADGVLLGGGLELVVGLTAAARVVLDFASGICVGTGGLIGFNPESMGQTALMARCGPG